MLFRKINTIIQEIENEPNQRLRKEKRAILADLLDKMERLKGK